MLYMVVFKPKECHLPALRDLTWSSSEEKLEIAEKLKCAPIQASLLCGYGNTLTELRPSLYQNIRPYARLRTRCHTGF